jgi:hypothetical protein
MKPIKLVKFLILSAICILFTLLISCDPKAETPVLPTDEDSTEVAIDSLSELNPLKDAPFISDPINNHGEDVFIDITMPNEISQDEISLLKENETRLASLFKQMSSEGIVNNYQRIANLAHDIYAAYFANNKAIFSGQSPDYVYTEGWMGLRWKHFYKDRMDNEYSNIVKTAWYVDRDKYANLFYVSRIYFAFLLSIQTDSYGPMPITSEHIRGDIKLIGENCKYTKQENIYDAIFRLLEDAITNIKPFKTNDFFSTLGNNDQCYGGDLERWQKFANTLRLRLALRIVNVDPLRARLEAEKSLNNDIGIIGHPAENMTTLPTFSPLNGNSGNPNIYAMCSFNYADACLSKDMELAYKNQSNILDPRCSISFYRASPRSIVSTGKENPNDDYIGSYIGNPKVDQCGTYLYSLLKTHPVVQKDLLDDYWFGFSRECVWLSHAEAQFLLAEAALRGWYPGNVKELFEGGIRASMTYYKINPIEIDKYINELTIYKDSQNNPFLSTDKETILEQIITQKWLAVFPNGNEGWAEFRRTDYPRLLRHRNNASSDVPQGQFIKRIDYPGDEILYNKYMINTIHQGTRVWWDVSNTNNDIGKRKKQNNFR